MFHDVFINVEISPELKLQHYFISVQIIKVTLPVERKTLKWPYFDVAMRSLHVTTEVSLVVLSDI